MEKNSTLGSPLCPPLPPAHLPSCLQAQEQQQTESQAARGIWALPFSRPAVDFGAVLGQDTVPLLLLPKSMPRGQK